MDPSHGARSSLAFLRESADIIFLFSFVCLWSGGRLGEKGKLLRGAVLICFYILLLLLPPKKSPARAVSDQQHCQTAREGWNCSWIWEANGLNVFS